MNEVTPENVPPIQIKGLSAGYGKELVIEDVDLTVKEGDFLGIIGPNGGGKSTLLKCILGLLEPVKGEIKIYGERPKVGRHFIGYVPQYAVYDQDYPISVWDVVLMGNRRTRGLRPGYGKEDREAAERSLQEVDMLEYSDHRISELSGGQRQRVFMARALVSRPKILLLDEPTASLDTMVKESIYTLLSKLNKEITIVVVTHDIGVISSYIRRVGCLNRYIHVHDEGLITADMLSSGYTCPVDLVAHGVPHRVLKEH